MGEPGTNDFDTVGYGAPCPPQGDEGHRYVFTLYALDTEALGLGETSRRPEFDAAVKGHVLDTATLRAVYRRR